MIGSKKFAINLHIGDFHAQAYPFNYSLHLEVKAHYDRIVYPNTTPNQ